MQLLPSRPLVVKTGFAVWSVVGGALMLVLGVAIAGGFVFMESHDARDLLEIKERWERSVPTDARVGGEVTTSNFIFDDYELDVTYLDLEGAERRAKYEFVTLLGGPSAEDDVSVRFDPERPDAPVVSWAAEYTGARWRAVAFLVVVGLLMAAGCAFFGWQAIGRWRSAVLAGKASTEVHCPVVGVSVRNVQGQQYLDLQYQIPEGAEVPAVAHGTTHKASFRPKKRGPLFVDPEGSLLVALVPRDRATAPIAMAEDIHPFVLSPGQRMQYEETRRALAKAAV
jgi:hypothetical protein